ncbi:MAG: hypothetical protein CUN56_05055 [Phototrophicales bacterium]|nr:MAG: hypothetical protein CUN56_05055 [Phototrophicales bacterium]
MTIKSRSPYQHTTHQPGCLLRAGLFFLAFFACFMFTCGLSLLGYVLTPPPPVTVLIMGLDSRQGEGYLARTDSVMLLGVQPNKLQVSLLSIPRDIFIRVPGYSASQRINTINLLGELEAPGTGPELLKQSLALSFNIIPTHYIRIDFRAFEAMIDAVGGVTINVPYEIVDPYFPTDDYGTMSIRFEAGSQHMNGKTALIYARTRHMDDDYRRAERQQQVVTAFARRAFNPLTWVPLLQVFYQYVDTDLTPLQLIQIAPALLLSGFQVEQLVIDRDWILPGTNGPIPNYDRLIPWLSDHFPINQ